MKVFGKEIIVVRKINRLNKKLREKKNKFIKDRIELLMIENNFEE